jgi:hypothetical protein
MFRWLFAVMVLWLQGFLAYPRFSVLPDCRRWRSTAATGPGVHQRLRQRPYPQPRPPIRRRMSSNTIAPFRWRSRAPAGPFTPDARHLNRYRRRQSVRSRARERPLRA